MCHQKQLSCHWRLETIAQLNHGFAVTVFTYCKNWGKLPVTEGKHTNNLLPMGKKLSFLTGIFEGKSKLSMVRSRRTSEPWQ